MTRIVSLPHRIGDLESNAVQLMTLGNLPHRIGDLEKPRTKLRLEE